MHVMQLPEPKFYFEFYLAIQLHFFYISGKRIKNSKIFFFIQMNFSKTENMY